MSNTRNRTSSKDIGYGLYLYFLGLSTRSVAKALSFLHIVKRSHVAIWNWIHKYPPQKIPSKRKKIPGFIDDETVIKVGSEYTWLWVAIEPKNSEILALSISKERNMFVAERFIAGLVDTFGKYPVSTDGGTWYPQACGFLKLRHHIHTPLEKSPIERTMQCIKDRTECFDDYFPCRLENCKMKHVRIWLRFFADYHNSELIASK